MISRYAWLLIFGVLNVSCSGSLSTLDTAPRVKTDKGAEVGNGGGLAEKYVMMAYTHLGSYIKDYGREIAFHPNSSRPEEWKVLDEILRDLETEYEKAGSVFFVSGKEHPGFFLINGQLKVAKTGDNVGDAIFVNSDLLYTTVRGETIPITIPVAASVLIHEMGHHHGIKDCKFLDQVGTAVQVWLEQSILEAKRITEVGPIKAQYIPTRKKQLIVSSYNKFQFYGDSLDIEPHIIAGISWCDKDKKATDYELTNMYWSKNITYSMDWNGDRHLNVVTLRLQIAATCVAADNLAARLSPREVAIHLKSDQLWPAYGGPFMEVLDCEARPVTCL